MQQRLGQQSGWKEMQANWLDARRRDLGMWAFALNRATGVLLVLYLFLHLIVLSQLAMGPAGYDRFISLMKSPLFLAFDVGLIAVLLYHGLNGLRVTLVMLGVGVSQHRAMFWVAMAVSLLALLYSTYLIFL
ncbi:MAG: succinate dehydrogenase, cytochrome b556 subunit [Chloroflexi bacterium]|nr:MAG: succinate dehydrogenase, cytochrome b556 subunit [Chloroflexota bacterium]